MARILILQDDKDGQGALRRSLNEHHQLVVLDSIESALDTLKKQHFDLVISRVHLQHASMFSFLRAVKKDPELKSIPFVCFCGRRTARAQQLDPVLSSISQVCGADNYISINDFCGGSRDSLEAIRSIIETCLEGRN